MTGGINARARRRARARARDARPVERVRTYVTSPGADCSLRCARVPRQNASAMACVLFGSRRFTVAVDVNVRDTFGAGAFLVAAADATAVPLGSDGRPLAPLVAGASYSLLSSSSTQLKQQLKETTGKLNAARNDLAKLSDRHAKLITTVGAELVHLRSLVSLGDSEAAAAAPSSGLGQLLSALPAEPSGSALAHAPPPTAECADGGAPGALRPWSGVPIGEVRTCFIEKNGTPRQGCVCPSSTATLTLKLGAGLNAVHSLEGLSHFSHVWLLFIFDQNGNAAAKSKVHPPRLDGAKVGLFATRTPHRPNNIGLSLVRLQKVAGDTLHLSGVDLVDHTPILDVKPYVPFADGFALPSPPSVAPWLATMEARPLEARYWHHHHTHAHAHTNACTRGLGPKPACQLAGGLHGGGVRGAGRACARVPPFRRRAARAAGDCRGAQRRPALGALAREAGEHGIWLLHRRAQRGLHLRAWRRHRRASPAHRPVRPVARGRAGGRGGLLRRRALLLVRPETIHSTRALEVT